MKVDGKPFRSIWLAGDGRSVEIIDQTRLPHAFVTVRLETLEDAAEAIGSMLVRGAPLIGATAAYGLCLALQKDASDHQLDHAYEVLLATRPTAANLRRALDDMRDRLGPLPPTDRLAAAYRRAAEICDEDIAINESIGDHGLELIRHLQQKKSGGERLNILTHCNAGWLATVDGGTALAPVYRAHDGVPHAVVADSVGGHLMQHGMVDMCLVGSDRTTASGDVCNKVGTYLKALAAKESGVPFYVALPSPTIDWTIDDGLRDIPIEERDPSELSTVTGRDGGGEVVTVSILPEGSPAANYAFDVTPGKIRDRPDYRKRRLPGFAPRATRPFPVDGNRCWTAGPILEAGADVESLVRF